MPRISEQAKQSGLERVFLTVKRYAPRGVTEAEISSYTGIQRRTVNNYLNELGDEGKVFKDALVWLPTDFEETRLLSFEVTPAEGYTLAIGGRLLVKQHDKRNELAESALIKLADKLVSETNIGQEIAQAAQELAQRPVRPGYQPIFQTMVEAYLKRQRVEIVYKPLGYSKGFTTTFETYLIEPSAIGFSTYVIGRSSIVSDLRAYKLERIQSAEPLRNNRYRIPDDFPGLQILRNSWSIIMGDETVRVVLRFSPEVRERVQETQWHPSEADEEDKEKKGWLRWWVDVADTMDMVPWIRGWGMDCEVLEPAKLLQDIKEHVTEQAHIYHVMPSLTTAQNPAIPAYHWLWAKADKKTKEIHPLIYHMIDVGQAALALWQEGLHGNLKSQIAKWLTLSVDDAGRLIAFWASLHDLGKASPAFQDHPSLLQFQRKLYARIIHRLKANGFTIPPRPGGDTHARHEIITTWSLNEEKLLTTLTKIDELLAILVTQSLGGHHGAWPGSGKRGVDGVKDDDHGDPFWMQTRVTLIKEMIKRFDPPALSNYEPNTLLDNTMFTMVSAIVSVADWLGSSEEGWFPYEPEHLPLSSYTHHAWQHARHALLRSGWQIPPVMPVFNFQRVFGFKPKQAQQEAIDAISNLMLPALVIVEAPMGYGKTELAQAIYALWARKVGRAGLYIAMPTTATSNQMHERTANFLNRQFGFNVEPMLVHSQALLREVSEEDETIEEQDKDGDRAAAQSWFLPRKKSLLVPFGVGTVDQTLMSVLQTKHFFVRLFGLSNKVVIFDEVHAYDVYMNELFTRLLAWLKEIGTSVIVLSATLPEKARESMVRAYAGNNVALPTAGYPRLTLATNSGQIEAVALTPPDAKTLCFEWIKHDETVIIDLLRQELSAGGCAAVICNTISQTQRIYEELRDLDEPICDSDNLILFHARYPMAWREEIEQKVLRKFGPGEDKSKSNPDRPSAKAIVVATQVIEQSLDLDFDVMISIHAPIDLLLQRAGRLHRHPVNDPVRKQPYRLWIAEPEVVNNVPKFEVGDTFVYDKYILLRSWGVLKNITTKEIRLPTDLSNQPESLNLIEQVYGDIEPATTVELQAAMAEAQQKMRREENDLRSKAKKHRIELPDNEDLLWCNNQELEEDDPAVHETFQALTRADRPGISVVCLHRIGGQLLIEPDDPESVYAITAKLDKHLIRELARHTINIRHPDPDIEKYLLAEPDEPLIKAILNRWKKVAALRYHRVVIFDATLHRVPGTHYVLKLDKENKLGLQISKEN